MSHQRKLAAIMFTDIVGYTALMGRDEEKALQLLHKNRDLLKPLIKEHRGNWLKEIGDGTLSSFASAVEAVKCALDIQKILKDDPELTLRIGIHIGDLVFEEGDIFGDGVNVASRIEPMAAPGGICVSGRVYDDIRNKPEIETVYLGEQSLKNVDHPVKVYALTGEGLATPLAGAAAAGDVVPQRQAKGRAYGVAGIIVIALLAIAFGVWSRWSGSRLTARLRSDTIAVMYFENLAGDAAFDWLEVGMVEMLTANLGHMEGMEVISSQRLSDILRQVTGGQARRVDRATATRVAQQAGAGRMLLGSVMGSGEQFRLNAELVNVETGHLLGTETIDIGPGGTIFALVDTLSQRLAERLGGGDDGESGGVSVTATLTSSLAALRLYVDGVEALNRLQYQRAAELLEAAVGVDTTFAMAYYQLFIAHDWTGKGELSDQAVEEAGRHSQRLTPRERRLIEAELQPTLKTKKEAYEALVVDYPDEKMAWYRYGEVLGHAFWPRAAGVAFRRAVDLDPDFTLAYAHVANWYYGPRGEYDRAREYIHHLRALDSTALSPYLNQAGLERHAGRPEQERAVLERLLQVAGEDTLNTTVYIAKMILAQRDWEFQQAVELAAAYRAHAFFENATSALAGYSMARGQMAAAREVAAENSPGRRSRLLAMGALYTGDLATARELLNQRLAELEQSGPVNEELAQVRFHQFLVQNAEGDEAGMRRTLKELQRLTRGTQSRQSVSVPIAEGYLLCWEGDHAGAVARFESAIPESQALFRRAELLILEGITSCLAEKQQWAEVLDRLQPERLRSANLRSPYRLLLVRLPLRRARALAALGRQYEALEAYRELLDQLRDADQDFPYLIAARNEYQQLRGQVVN